MTGIYYVDAADWLRDAGLVVIETDGWQTRARSSGGFAAAPLGVVWHHTASHTSPENDIAWQTEGSEDAPIGNATIMRDGSVWMVAAGAANTAGKGGPVSFSRGTCEQDKGNTTLWNFEVANDGVGEPWPQVQIDAYFTASNTMNRQFGNRSDDLCTHKSYTDGSCRGRKIDPATASAVQGPWQPRSETSSGTWSLDDIKAEALRRADDDEEDAVTDEEIEAIAQRAAELVWKFPMTDPPTQKPSTTGAVLGYARHSAANADAQTKPQT